VQGCDSILERLGVQDGGTYCGDGGSGFPDGCIATLGPLTVAGILAPMDGGSLNPDGELLPDGGNPLNGIQVSIYCMLYDEGYCSGNTLFTSEWSTPSTPGPNGVVQVSMPEALTTGMNCTCPKSIFCSVRTTGSCGPAQYTTFCRPLNDPNHLTPDLSPLVVGPLWVDCPPLTPDAGTPDAGTPDAGTPDAGTEEPGTADAGTAD
jgi:hypothetical protein